MTSPRKRTPGVSPESGLAAGGSRGCSRSPAPRSGAEPCRGAGLGADLWPTAGEERGYSTGNTRERREEPHLDGDGGIGVSAVKDGPEVEFGISFGSEDL